MSSEISISEGFKRGPDIKIYLNKALTELRKTSYNMDRRTGDGRLITLHFANDEAVLALSLIHISH